MAKVLMIFKSRLGIYFNLVSIWNIYCIENSVLHQHLFEPDIQWTRRFFWKYYVHSAFFLYNAKYLEYKKYYTIRHACVTDLVYLMLFML